MRSQFIARSLPARPVAARLSASLTLGIAAACFSTLALTTLTITARADTQIGGPSTPLGAVAVTPGSPKGAGTPIAIVSSLDTSGNAAMARRALMAADAALRHMSGFTPVPMTSRYAPVTQNKTAAGQATVNWHWPLTGRDYQDFGKVLKAPRALSLTVSPGEGDNAYIATAELYDTKSGGLVGLGHAASTITDTAPAADAKAPTLTPQERALDSAVQNAVFELSRTATYTATVVSKPGAYLTRLSLGEKDGVRGGSRVEYLVNGIPVGFGTITDVGFGESVATVAPETAFPGIYVNSTVRIVNTPTSDRSIPPLSTIDERDFARFERSFTFAAAIVGAVYLAVVAAD